MLVVSLQHDDTTSGLGGSAGAREIMPEKSHYVVALFLTSFPDICCWLLLDLK